MSDPERCYYCNGTGHYKTPLGEDHVCTVCGGTGVIIPPDHTDEDPIPAGD